MTPPERAAYLIKELGYDKALDLAIWVISEAAKDLTRQYWQEVIDEITKAKYSDYYKAVRTHCIICDAPIPEGSGYCMDCKPKL